MSSHRGHARFLAGSLRGACWRRAGPNTSSPTRAFGAIDVGALQKYGAVGELRLGVSLVEMGLMAGAACFVPSPKTDLYATPFELRVSPQQICVPLLRPNV